MTSSRERGTQSEFGNIAPVSSRLLSVSLFLKLFLVGICVSILLGVAWAAIARGIEFTEPTADISGDFTGIGIAERNLKVLFSDDGSGLTYAEVALRQGAALHPLYAKDFNREKSGLADIKIVPSEIALKDGSAEIVVTVRDGAVSSNTLQKVFPVLIDRVPPQISLEYFSKRGRANGMGLVVFRFVEEHPQSQAVHSGEYVFPANLAGQLDRELADSSRYAALLVLQKNAPTFVLVRDAAGNETRKPLPIEVEDRVPGKTTEIRLTGTGVMEAYGVAIEMDLRDRGEAGVQAVLDRLSAARNGDAKAGNALLSQVLAGGASRAIQNAIGPLLRRGQEQRRWDSVPAWSSNLVVKLSFGDRVAISTQIGEVWGGVSESVVFEPRGPLLSVDAPMRGTVVYTGDIGILGRTVVLDSGFGVFFIFYNLENVAVELNQQVETGISLGIMGRSGIAGGTQVSVMTTIAGVVSDPQEWLDPSVYRNVVATNVEAAKAAVVNSKQ